VKRWFFNLAAAVSLVLCIIVVALWLGGSLRTDWWRWSTDSHTYQIATHGGQLSFMKIGVALPVAGIEWQSADRPDSAGYRVHVGRGDSRKLWIGTLLYGVGRFSSEPRETPDRRFWWLSIQSWFVLLVAGLPLLLCGLNALMRRRLWLARTRQGLCPTCGYDLRASPSRCPECGTVPSLKGVT
jgi:hypothetical protein